jgi:hypothetical protein
VRVSEEHADVTLVSLKRDNQLKPVVGLVVALGGERGIYHGDLHVERVRGVDIAFNRYAGEWRGKRYGIGGNSNHVCHGLFFLSGLECSATLDGSVALTFGDTG